MHCSQHASDEFVNTIAFLYQRDECGDSAFVVRSTSKMRENEFLEGIDLVLECHEIGYGFIARDRISHLSRLTRMAPPYPSFGSLIDFKLIYSSYSKRPYPN